jgi:hypothetical protein
MIMGSLALLLSFTCERVYGSRTFSFSYKTFDV